MRCILSDFVWHVHRICAWCDDANAVTGLTVTVTPLINGEGCISVCQYGVHTLSEYYECTQVSTVLYREYSVLSFSIQAILYSVQSLLLYLSLLCSVLWVRRYEPWCVVNWPVLALFRNRPTSISQTGLARSLIWPMVECYFSPSALVWVGTTVLRDSPLSRWETNIFISLSENAIVSRFWDGD